MMINDMLKSVKFHDFPEFHEKEKSIENWNRSNKSSPGGNQVDGLPADCQYGNTTLALYLWCKTIRENKNNESGFRNFEKYVL